MPPIAVILAARKMSSSVPLVASVMRVVVGLILKLLTPPSFLNTTAVPPKALISNVATAPAAICGVAMIGAVDAVEVLSPST